MSKREYVDKLEKGDKERQDRGFFGRLLEYLLWIRMFPILVIAFDREIKVKTGHM